ncbi:hypothetical protein IW262DRAFT_1297385 [Armillaria fumosa]|nr:hypothetical protein IW262DRAFT_1297385 [Armillaria fumosa]
MTGTTIADATGLGGDLEFVVILIFCSFPLLATGDHPCSICMQQNIQPNRKTTNGTVRSVPIQSTISVFGSMTVYNKSVMWSIHHQPLSQGPSTFLRTIGMVPCYIFMAEVTWATDIVSSQNIPMFSSAQMESPGSRP